MTKIKSFIMILICILTIIIILYLIESDNFSPKKQIKKYISRGKFNRAIYFLDKYSEKLDPIFFYNNKILALSKIKEFNTAYELSIEALKNIKNPNHQLYNNIAFVYYNLNLYHKAIELSNKALSLNPLDLFALSNKGFAHIKIGEYEKAEACFDKALEFNPSFKNALSGKSYCTYEKEDYEKTAQLLEKFISIDPTEATAYKKLGECYFYLNKIKASKKMYEKALSLNPKDSMYYCEYANILIYIGLYDEALEVLDTALTLSPYNFIAFYYKTRAYALKKDNANALYYLERAIAHCPCIKQIALEDNMINNLKFFSKFKELLDLK